MAAVLAVQAVQDGWDARCMVAGQEAVLHSPVWQVPTWWQSQADALEAAQGTQSSGVTAEDGTVL